MYDRTPDPRPKRCDNPRCIGRHCAGGEHRPRDERELVRAAETLTTEARVHTR